MNNVTSVCCWHRYRGYAKAFDRAQMADEDFDDENNYGAPIQTEMLFREYLWLNCRQQLQPMANEIYFYFDFFQYFVGDEKYRCHIGRDRTIRRYFSIELRRQSTLFICKITKHNLIEFEFDSMLTGQLNQICLLVPVAYVDAFKKTN